MKTLRFSYLFALCLLLSSCTVYPYSYPAPPQSLPNLTTDKNTTVVKIINKTGGNVEFFKGPLKDLILAPREHYTVRLRWGYQKLGWSQVLIYRHRIEHYGDYILVTHNSKTLVIYPPEQDDMFRTRGTGSLELRDY